MRVLAHWHKHQFFYYNSDNTDALGMAPRSPAKL